VPELHLAADMGVGALWVGHDFFDRRDRPGRWGDDFDRIDASTNRIACEGTA
jgi:hypothetical protein